MIAETVSEKHVVRLQFSPDGNKIVYVTEDHNLFLYNIQTGKTDNIVKLDESIKYLKMINVQDYSIIACGNVDSLKVYINEPVDFNHCKRHKFRYFK